MKQPDANKAADQAMKDTSHLSSLKIRLVHEQSRLAASKTKSEREMRTVWVTSIEKEIAGEYKFLGLKPELTTEEDVNLTDEELLAELLG